MSISRSATFVVLVCSSASCSRQRASCSPRRRHRISKRSSIARGGSCRGPIISSTAARGRTRGALDYLIYTDANRMCALLMDPNRPKWKDPRAPTGAEATSAILGMTAYCGNGR
jgi:hypothetical protein